MKLRFAFGTVPYGRRITDIERVFDQIAGAGYEGVEICQAPNMIGNANSHLDVQKIAAERGLSVLGYVGGTLESRMKFCDESFDGYLVIDDWDTRICEQVMAKGFRLAYHPHVLHEVATVEDARKRILTKHPELLLLPDTGHMGVNGEDMMQLANDSACLKRLAAVHLKDWEPQFGRHSHRYARGFVELGTGDLKDEIQALLQKLTGSTFRDELWTIAEVDSCRASVSSTVLACADWLRQQRIGMPEAKKRESICEYEKPLADTMPTDVECPWTPEAEIRFCHEVLNAASRDTAGFYQEVADAFSRLLPCIVTEVRVYTPQLQGLELASYSGPDDWNPSPFISVSPDGEAEKNMSHRAVLAQRCLLWDLPHPDFQRPERIEKHGLRQMLAVPVVNSWNAHHVRFLINLFPDIKLTRDHDPCFERLADVVSRAADLMLDERCLMAAGEMQYEKAAYSNSRDFYKSLIRRIQGILGCEGVAIFHVARTRRRLELAATTGTEWRPDVKDTERHYHKGDGSHTGNVWLANRIFYKRYEPSDVEKRAKSWETVPSADDDCLMALISRRGSGKPVLGIVRCRNRSEGSRHGPKMFTDDDAAALDTLLQAALPQLELLLDQEFRQQSLRRLLHEFNVPNNAIRHCVQRVKLELKKSGRDPHTAFSQDFLGDIWDYTELIGRQLQNADKHGGEIREMPPSFEATDLYADVIAPSVNHVGGLLKLNGLSPRAIYYASLVAFPPLWIDRIQFQQVFFNLLSNAIKYGGGAGVFRVQIDGGIQHEKQFILRFSDFGPGIREEDKEDIFDPGWRSPDAWEKNIYGHGLGLPIVRDIIQAHGGTILLAKCKNPTRFVITLPFSLAFGHPSIHYS